MNILEGLDLTYVLVPFLSLKVWSCWSWGQGGEDGQGKYRDEEIIPVMAVDVESEMWTSSEFY